LFIAVELAETTGIGGRRDANGPESVRPLAVVVVVVEVESVENSAGMADSKADKNPGSRVAGVAGDNWDDIFEARKMMVQERKRNCNR
jgi:hypothetical protein